MLAVAGILAASVMIVAIEVPSLLKNGQIKELWAFSVLLLLGIGLSVAVALHVDIPNPLNAYIAVFKPVSDFLFAFLK
ncbi:hypothetical protein [Paenibacillus thalictri]|uniref:Uncharacterized protein n=1 Tax=Paenibacillus thalictri TaxID=2527873 RepID=A0A4Q9DXL8_9BACL|nr:hypothetical protein [Paenibacillus thalictri]TBL81146.1 hypothetical protein EYB31_03365 [Paenibacillus thalictri]